MTDDTEPYAAMRPELALLTESSAAEMMTDLMNRLGVASDQGASENECLSMMAHIIAAQTVYMFHLARARAEVVTPGKLTDADVYRMVAREVNLRCSMLLAADLVGSGSKQ